MRSTPVACIIKLITAVIYGFHNKLQCLAQNSILGWKGLPGTNTPAITETVNYGRERFYEIDPWA
jgi:hypothetical protein